ncbi:hypothetical protein [Legionella feeleii]|uniref:Uncharacterized protein n=2 Tax=Legionella feeleii TaxID=453 RepID=A0A0W0TGU6_9GAMM|nr:hypothetical protein [Legionella feeleii]KTC94820.1 hypothetical protein Lfee_2484 [Legionella feeleii]SPX60383.1 Uncharacterised protein [Legionella feeleii]
MREKQEGKLSLGERKIIIAGRMGENDARRGKPRKDFSMTNKSQEYISSYNAGYDKIALERIQTKKKQMPSSALPTNMKRARIAIEAPVGQTDADRSETPCKKTDTSGQRIRNMPSYQRVTVAGRTITVDAFLKRHYVFQDTKEEVSRHALYQAVLFEDGTITVNGRLIEWDTKLKKGISGLIKIGKENPITKSGFLKRTYVFKDTGEVVSKEAQRAAQIHEDGTVSVNGKLIEWRKKCKIRDRSIGEEETDEIQGDVIHDGSEKEIGVKEEDFSLSSGDYEAPAGLEFDVLWKMLIPDYIGQGVNPGTQGNDKEENAALSSALSDVAGSPGFDEFKKELMADILRVNPEGRGQSLAANPFERGEAGAEGGSELSPQARKPYSPQFFSYRGSSEQVAAPRQVFDTSMSSDGGKEPDRDRTGPHWQPAYFTQQFVKEEKADEVNNCILC